MTVRTRRPGKYHDEHRCVVWLSGAQLRAVRHLAKLFGPEQSKCLNYLLTSQIISFVGTPLLPHEFMKKLAEQSHAATKRRRAAGRKAR